MQTVTAAERVGTSVSLGFRTTFDWDRASWYLLLGGRDKLAVGWEEGNFFYEGYKQPVSASRNVLWFGTSSTGVKIIVYHCIANNGRRGSCRPYGSFLDSASILIIVCTNYVLLPYCNFLRYDHNVDTVRTVPLWYETVSSIDSLTCLALYVVFCPLLCPFVSGRFTLQCVWQLMFPSPFMTLSIISSSCSSLLWIFFFS